MAYVDPVNMEVVAKVVFWGPARCGKTETLGSILRASPESVRRISLPPPLDAHTEALLLELGLVQGYSVHIFLTALHNTFNLTLGEPLLKDPDAVVLVLDSEPGREEDNARAAAHLNKTLRYGEPGSADPPLLIQYNKRDLPAAHPIETLRASVTGSPAMEIETVAARGEGTMETLKSFLKVLLPRLRAALENA